MADPIPHYARRYRLRAGLTQKELAQLLGNRSPATVCQYEAQKREPDLRTALAYQLIFGVPIEQLFPGIRREVEQAVLARADRLAQALTDARKTLALAHKREALRAIAAASGGAPHDNP
jgi:transcriptional regulator with XRE-family HTH domain